MYLDWLKYISIIFLDIGDFILLLSHYPQPHIFRTMGCKFSDFSLVLDFDACENYLF